ncbi:MAG: hypothetical protein WCQ99_10085 [Pseudomonadota bacterium]
MTKEFRIMLLSEKSGRKYSVKIKLLPMLMLASGFFCLIGGTVFSAISGFNISHQNNNLHTQVRQLEIDLQRLKDENREAVLYKQWADAIIFRRFNYEDSTGKGTAGLPKSTPEAPTKNIPSTSEQQDVDIDEFDVRRINLDLDFEVSFKLINRSRSGKKLSGYLYLIALNNDVKPEIYSSWPAGEIISGAPRDYKKGSTFSISYLKQVKGRITQPEIGSKFNRLDVIAYAEDGTVIMKRGFYIERFLQQSPYE